MGAGLAGLVALAVVLGSAFPLIENLLGQSLPEDFRAQLFGLVAALAGLTLGWFIPVRFLMWPILPWARKGFSIAGGFDGSMVRPVLAVARLCDRLEGALYASVLWVGQLGMNIGLAARRGDDQAIDGLIFSLVRGTVKLGESARTLQSGLIHRQMAITVAGTALIFVTLFMASLVY